MQRKEIRHEESSFVRYLGAAAAGILEIALFHPLDTLVKRLQKNKNPIRKKHLFDMKAYSPVVFPGLPATPSISKQAGSLYKGVGAALGYKVPQRVIKFGSKPIIHKMLQENLTPETRKKIGPVVLQGMAGAAAGALEIIILPLDKFKIQIQTAVYKGKGSLDFCKFIFSQEAYHGAATTLVRNAKGSFALFGTEAYVMKHMFGLENHRDATWIQAISASILSATASIVITHPDDTVKTRIQSSEQKAFFKGITIAYQMVTTEGPMSLFKGLIPKASGAVPKVAFTMLFAPVIAEKIGQFTQSKPETPNLTKDERATYNRPK